MFLVLPRCWACWEIKVSISLRSWIQYSVLILVVLCMSIFFLKSKKRRQAGQVVHEWLLMSFDSRIWILKPITPQSDHDHHWVINSSSVLHAKTWNQHEIVSIDQADSQGSLFSKSERSKLSSPWTGYKFLDLPESSTTRVGPRAESTKRISFR